MKRIMVFAAALATAVPLLAGMAPAASGAPSPGGLPIIRDQGQGASRNALPVISINWSGYAATSKKKFTYVSGKFIQPSIKCTGAKYVITSNWVGLDGFTNSTVEQDGTFARCAGKNSMTPSYQAWYEMYPAGSVVVFSVKPGDTISASVSVTSGNFVLTIADLTSKQSHTQTATCSSCMQASAEWIIERAAFCANKTCSKAVIGALPDFGTTTMKDALASTGGAKSGISSFTNDPIQGVYNLNDTEAVGPKGFISVDTVSAVNTQKNSFTATFNRSGKPCPIQL